MRNKDLRSLANKYSDRGEMTKIALGLRPSGIIHLGNMATMSLAGILGREVGQHLSTVDVTVCDLDLPDKADWSVKESGYVRYFNTLPAPDGNGSLLDKAMGQIEDYASGLEGHTGVDFSIRKLSSIQRDPRFRGGLKKILDTPGIMQYILKKVPEKAVLVYPLCGECGTSNPAIEEPNTYEDGVIHTRCTNDDCKVGEYDVDVLDTDRDLAVHFFIDPIRDKAIPPYSDVHVFGGDYAEDHDNCHGNEEQFYCEAVGIKEGPITKLEKIAAISGLASGGDLPDYLIGPKFYASNGETMSKKKNNGLSIDVLRDHFGEDYSRRVIDFMSDLVNQDFRNVDYRIVEERLFDKK